MPPPWLRRGPSTHISYGNRVWEITPQQCDWQEATPALLLSTRLHLSPWPVSELVPALPCLQAPQHWLHQWARPLFLPDCAPRLQNLASFLQIPDGYSGLAPDPTTFCESLRQFLLLDPALTTGHERHCPRSPVKPQSRWFHTPLSANSAILD